MALKLHNTLTKKKQIFNPLVDNEVRMYSCGPTSYDFAHIGNFRAYICSDILKRYLKYKGYGVAHIMNITDVDDKTIRDSNKAKIPLTQFTEKYTQAFFEDIKTLNIEPANIFPKATEHIQEMIDIIQVLEQKGHTYIKEGSVYYRISTFKEYSKLSGVKIEEEKDGARIDADEYEKESAKDFVLWKAQKPGEPAWDSPWGKGRPGWHIECSAMSMKYLGPHFDIHTGGIDLIFPHHENEIAQSEAATGEPFVNFWLHNEYLFVEGKKMSKSLGNFFTLRDILKKGHKPLAVRYLLLSAHYRTPLNFTEDGLKATRTSIDRLYDLMERLRKGPFGPKDNSAVPKALKKTQAAFEKAMDDDLNISGGLAAIFDVVKALNKLQISKADADLCVEFFEEIDRVLGLNLTEVGTESLDAEIGKLVQKREEARKRKDFRAADRIRDELKKKGIELQDTPQGVRWKRTN